jgi:pimeloyl-ACP methyl ester carboxylesterase
MNRRDFIHSATGLVAGATLARVEAQTPSRQRPKTIRTNILEIGYHESGTAAGFPVILLHGFPDDAHAYDGVAPALARAGYRPLAVYLRGYGPTRFLNAEAARTAEQAAIGQDVIDFADALELPRFALAGFDWGGRAACVASALHPDRVRAALLIGGYTIQNTVTPGRAAAPEASSAAFRCRSTVVRRGGSGWTSEARSRGRRPDRRHQGPGETRHRCPVGRERSAAVARRWEELSASACASDELGKGKPHSTLRRRSPVA